MKASITIKNTKCTDLSSCVVVGSGVVVVYHLCDVVNVVEAFAVDAVLFVVVVCRCMLFVGVIRLMMVMFCLFGVVELHSMSLMNQAHEKKYGVSLVVV